MSQIENTTGGVGVVDVAGLQITVSPLSLKEERVLWKKLRKGAKAAKNAVPFAERPAVKSLLLSLQTVPVAYMEAVRELVRMAAAAETTDATDDELFAFRTSPAGVALELFERGRSATPGLDLAGLQAVITSVNADDVFEEMMTIAEGTGPGK